MDRHKCCDGYVGHGHRSVNCPNYEPVCPDWITFVGHRHELYMQELVGRTVYRLPDYKPLTIQYLWLGRNDWPITFRFEGGDGDLSLHKIVGELPSCNVPHPTAEQKYEMLRYEDA